MVCAIVMYAPVLRTCPWYVLSAVCCPWPPLLGKTGVYMAQMAKISDTFPFEVAKEHFSEGPGLRLVAEDAAR